MESKEQKKKKKNRKIKKKNNENKAKIYSIFVKETKPNTSLHNNTQQKHSLLEL